MGRPALKKGAIERSALELFVEKGVDGTSIRDIATRAGVTEGALYRHHKCKDDLVRALFFEHYEGFAKMIARVQASHAPFPQLILKLVETFFEFYDKDPHVFEFVLVVRHRLLDEVRADDSNPAELLVRIVKEAIKRKEIPDQDAELTKELLMGMVLQATIGMHYGRLKPPMAGYTKSVTAACLAISGAKA